MKKLLIIFLFLASTAYGEIYTWKDSTGTVHYTNSEYEIPEKYRPKAKVLNLGIAEKKDNSSPQQDTGSQQNAPPQPRELVQPFRPAQPPALQRPAGNAMREDSIKRVRPVRPPAD